MSTAEDRSSIGVTAIWAESEGIDRVSLTAVVLHCVRQAVENVRRSPITSLLTVITIAVAIFLLGIFTLFIHNSSQAVSTETGAMEIMVFLKESASQSDVDSISLQLREAVSGLPVTYTDKNEALNAFRRMLGEDARMLEGLDTENPLPASLQVRVTTAGDVERLYENVRERLAKHSKVESVRYTQGGVEQIKKMLHVVEVVGAVGVVFLFLVAGFIIANTIKLALYNHRMEVEIMELVGARRSSIFAPYMLEGLVQGTLGAGVGLLGVFLVSLLIGSLLAQAELLQMIFPSFSFIPQSYSISILVAGALVGVIGSFLAVRRFLNET